MLMWQYYTVFPRRIPPKRLWPIGVGDAAVDMPNAAGSISSETCGDGALKMDPSRQTRVTGANDVNWLQVMTSRNPSQAEVQNNVNQYGMSRACTPEDGEFAFI